MRISLLLPAALLACANVQDRPRSSETSAPMKAVLSSEANAAAPKAKLVCTLETPTGSHIPTRICRTPEEIELTRLRTQDALRGPRGATCVTGSNGQCE
jgi:hypothetical protein